MRRGFALLTLLLFVAGSALAAPTDPKLCSEAPRAGELLRDGVSPQFTHARDDTAFFGGDDGTGVAYLDGVWDFEDPGSNGFQGCSSWDKTSNPGIYFEWVVASDFTSHGDPCVPMIEGTPGMIWCGIHQDEADLRDFLAGMGYQNSHCQSAFSPEYAIDPANDDIDLVFEYFNHTEPGFDYSYCYVLAYDAVGELVEEHTVAVFDGIIGDDATPGIFDEGIEVPLGTLPPETDHVVIEFRMVSDGGWSDEDGLWDSPCGPFAVDDLSITVGATTDAFDFNDGPQGFTFEKCPGKGAWLHIVHDFEYQEWLDDLGLTCGCTLVGDAVGFVSTVCQNGPALVPGQDEQFETGPIPREGYPAPFWNSAVALWDAFINLPLSAGSFYRPGWRKFPFTTEVNPVPHWSNRKGQQVWHYASAPYCALSGINLSTMDDDPLPVEWDSLKFVYEITCSCDAFALPPTTCTEEGCTGGAPVLDNLRVGLTNAADAPPVGFIDGGLFIDGFGQNYPTYLEPSDRCNANISYDLSMSDTEENDWHGDSSVVTGPTVSTEAGRFLCEFCFKVARLGARQPMIPEYHTWKNRLADDPEQDFVCVLMDSLETNNHTQVWRNKFATYFHEDATGYIPAGGGQPDFNEQNEILPDQVFVPGTRIEYYWRSYWYNGGAPPSEYYVLQTTSGPFEFELLPSMEIQQGEEYLVQWPSMLYVDGYNRGSEQYMLPTLEQLGIDFDKFDFLDNSSNYNASMKRDLGGTAYNPGGYGNNGCTIEQLLGYRLILWNNGNFGVGSCEPEDFEMFQSWLETTDCGLADIRRGIIFDGDMMCEVMADPVQGLAIDFCHNGLGTTLIAQAYRDHNEDPAYCVYVEPVDIPQYLPSDPGISLFGNGCPQEFNYNVLGVQTGVEGAEGNLRFWSYELTGNSEFIDFAQVVRVNEQAGVANWRSAVNGFSFHHLSERGCQGEPCNSDSICHIAGTADLFGPMIQWFEEGATPFQKWLYPCFSTSVGEDPAVPMGVNRLYQSRPNPFNTRATIRFSMASQGDVNLSVYDVSGRLVRTLMDAEAPAGENSVVWDGTDNNGNRVGGGIFWMQMSTHDGFSSGKKMLVLR